MARKVTKAEPVSPEDLIAQCIALRAHLDRVVVEGLYLVTIRGLRTHMEMLTQQMDVYFSQK